MKIRYSKRGKKIGATLIAILIVSIVTLTVAYAALSDTLTISGSGTVNAANWDITINNSQTMQNATTGTATYTEPVVSGTTISYSVNMSKPGDSVTLYFNSTNEGKLTGEIISVISSTSKCTSKTGDTEDSALICNNLETSLTYADGQTVTVGDIISQDNQVCYNSSTYWTSADTSFKIQVKLKDTMSTLPTSEVEITNMKYDIVYAPTEKSCEESSCFTAGTKVAVENGYKNIEDIKVGDYVYSYNLETNKKELKKVLKTFIHEKDGIYTLKVNNRLIHTTEEHPFYVINKGWSNTQTLNFNDKLLSIKNGPTIIKNISKRKFNTYVYNFEVEDNHNYLVSEEEILVHNKKVEKPPLNTDPTQ